MDASGGTVLGDFVRKPNALRDGNPEEVARIKCDYRQTLDDLIVEEVFPKWISWCHTRGVKTRNEAHGAPANLLDFYALADVPETEMFAGDQDILISKFASSAAHVAGKRYVSAESGTWILWGQSLFAAMEIFSG